MALKLQKLTGLTDADPIHRYLGLLDKCLGDLDWTNIGDLEFIETLRVTTQTLKVTDDLDVLQNVYQDRKPILAKVVDCLKRRMGQEGLDFGGVKAVLLFLIANEEDITKRYLEQAGRYRTLEDDWKPSMV